MSSKSSSDLSPFDDDYIFDWAAGSTPQAPGQSHIKSLFDTSAIPRKAQRPEKPFKSDGALKSAQSLKSIQSLRSRDSVMSVKPVVRKSLKTSRAVKQIVPGTMGALTARASLTKSVKSVEKAAVRSPSRKAGPVPRARPSRSIEPALLDAPRSPGQDSDGVKQDLPEPSNDPAALIAKTPDPVVEVVGVPGASKTGLLIDRIEHLVGQGVAPNRILVLSFANSTVDSFRARLTLELGAVHVKTCHALALELIHRNLSLLGRQAMPVVMTETAEFKLLGQAVATAKKVVTSELRILRRNGGDVENFQHADDVFVDLKRGVNLRQIRRLFSFKAVAASTLAKLVKRSFFAEWNDPTHLRCLQLTFKAYRRLKRGSNQITFGDMVAMAAEAVDVPDARIGPFKHVLVDEFQDCGPQQVKLLRRLAPRVSSLMVVGDPDQNIYGWMGSEHTRLAAPGLSVTEATLDYSRRLTDQNAALAMSVLGTGGRYIRTGRAGPLPTLHVHRTLRAEARGIAQQVQALLGSGAQPEHIAVLARTREVRTPIDAALRAAGVGTRLLGDEVDKKLPIGVAWLVHLLEKSDRIKYVTAPRLRLALQHMAAADTDWDRMARALLKVRTTSLEGRFKECTNIYLRMLGGASTHKAERNAINSWRATCRGLTRASQLRDLIETTSRAVGRVTLSTIHGAKGRQWEHVIVAAATEGVLPHLRSVDQLQLDEERRLLYVAVTRARAGLHLHHARQPRAGAADAEGDAPLTRFLDGAVRERLVEVRDDARDPPCQLALL